VDQYIWDQSQGVSKTCGLLVDTRDPLEAQLREGRQRGPRKVANYVQAAQEGLGMTKVCNGYPKVQIFKETVINIQQVNGGLWMSSLRRSSPPGSLIPNGLKELPMLYARTKRPKTGYSTRDEGRKGSTHTQWYAWRSSSSTRSWQPGF
jgi:hypothetical protein